MAATIKVWVADVVITQREVELPTVCPHCEADLTTPSSDGELTIIKDSLDETAEHGAIVVGSHYDGANTEETLELEGFETEGSDEVAILDVRCDACRKSVLAEPGTMKNIQPDGTIIQ